MIFLRSFLSASTLLIFPLSIYVILTMGINWTTVYFGDLVKLDWRSQFNADLFIFITLFAVWVTWREGFTLRGFLFGCLCFLLGGMFGCPYLLISTYKAQGNPRLLVMGVHADK